MMPDDIAKRAFLHLLGGAGIAAAHSIEEMQVRIRPVRWHKTGHQRMRLAVQSEVDLTARPRRNEDRFDLVDLFARTVQRQTQTIIELAEIRIGGDLRPAFRIDLLPAVSIGGNATGKRMRLARRGIENRKNAFCHGGKDLGTEMIARLDQQRQYLAPLAWQRGPVTAETGQVGLRRVAARLDQIPAVLDLLLRPFEPAPVNIA